MNRTRRLLAVTAVGAFLFVGAAGCGSSSGSDSSGDTTETTAADSGDTGTDDTTADEPDAGGEADCEATADSNNLSGDSVVLFSGDQTELSEADLTDDVIAVVSADGSSMDPAELEVAAGSMFGIKAGEGLGIDAAIIGCAGGQTMVPNTAIGFVITEPGTYPVSLEIAGTEVGTIVVS